MTLAFILYWSSLGIILYTYIGFPLILFVRSLLWPRPHKKSPITPSVSLIVAAHNEAEGIESKIANIHQLDYPADQFEAIIASDGSNDGTADVVAQHVDETITLLDLPRQGKADTLNAAIAQSSGEILVFSDANSLYKPGAIRQLVQHFADEQVGGVAGNQVYISTAETQDNPGETHYWNFDRQLKIWESASGNTISATGAIYAIRHSLFQPIPVGVTDDFVTSTRVIEQGYRLIFEPKAIAYEHVAKDQQREFGRKVRVMTRGLNAILMMGCLLNPFQYGFYAIQLFTHKLLRRLLYIPIVILLMANWGLVSQGIFYQLTLLGQVMLLGSAAIGWIMSIRGQPLPKLIALPTYACIVYLAAAKASWNVLRGYKIVSWSTERQAS